MKPPRDMESFAREALISTDEEASTRVLDKMRQAYERSARSGPASPPLGYWDLVFQNRFARLAAVAVVLLALGSVVGQFGDLWPGGGVAWADVTRRFQSVPFFSATIYIKEDATAEPTQMELWMSRDGRARIRLGAQVIFARDGAVTQAFDIKSRTVVEPDERAVRFLERIGRADEFSLDTVIRVMFGGEMQDVTPLVNPDAVISQDVVVFDVELPGTPEWVRVWALRESRLPVRIRVWDPRNGDATDAVFEYSRGQADEFFDPSVFEALLGSSRTTSSHLNIAYAFLKDPGGKDITPEDMFEGSGYHLPEIEQAGITPDGAVWVIAAKGRNRMPNGRNFYGFTRIRDDLGREYEDVYKSHRTTTDQSMDVFVPSDYPFDRRVPGRITLICEADDGRPTTHDELVGTVELTTWKQGRTWPEGTISDAEWSFRTRMAWKHCDGKRYDEAERILRTIEGEPEDHAAALERERIRLRMLMQQDKVDDAVSLGERLMPALEKDYRSLKGFGPNPSVFNDYILALAYTGELDRAKQTWQQVRSIRADLPATLPEPARKRVEESIQRDLDQCLRVMVPKLSRRGHLTVEQISDVFGFDITKHEEYKDLVERAERVAANRKARLAAEQRFREISDYYRTHPLPERMELLERPDNARIYLIDVPNTLPDHEGYSVFPINGSLRSLVSTLRVLGDNILPYEFIQCRIEDDTAEQELLADLVYRDGISFRERIEFILGLFDLEFVVEEGRQRKVLVARYNGQPLKDCEEVRTPFPYDHSATSKAGMLSTMAGPGFDMRELLRDLTFQQNDGIEQDDRKMVIVDETGIEGVVSTQRAFWLGDEGLKLARQWFTDEFGVTLTEEPRTMKTYVVRKKQQAK